MSTTTSQGTLHLTHISISCDSPFVYEFEASLGDVKSSRLSSGDSAATSHTFSSNLVFLPIHVEDFESSNLVFSLTFATTSSRLAQKKSTTMTFEEVPLDSLVLHLNSGDFSPVEATAGSYHFVLRFSYFFSGKELIYDMLSSKSYNREALLAICALRDFPSSILACMQHQPTLDKLVELTRGVITKPKTYKAIRGELEAVWTMFCESRATFLRLLDFSPDLPLNLLLLLANDRFKHAQRYYLVIPILRLLVDLPIAKKIFPILIALLEDSMTLVLDLPPLSHDSSAPAPVLLQDLSPKAKESLENVVLQFVNCLTFFDPKFAPVVAKRTRIVPLCTSILESAHSALYPAALNVVNWIGKEFSAILEQHGVFAALSRLATSPEHSSRAFEITRVLKQFGREEAQVSVGTILAALLTDLPPQKIFQFLDMLQMELLKKPVMEDTEILRIVDVCALLLTKTTRNDPLVILTQFIESGRVTEDIFFKSTYLQHWADALATRKGNFLTDGGIFRRFVFLPIAPTEGPEKRDAAIPRILEPLKRIEFWKRSAEMLKTLVDEPALPKESAHWTNQGKILWNITKTMIALLDFGPKELVMQAWDLNLFESLQRLFQADYFPCETEEDKLTLYVEHLYVLDRMFTIMDAELTEPEARTRLDKLSQNFVAGFALKTIKNDHRWHQGLKVGSNRIIARHVYKTSLDWADFAKRWISKEPRIVPIVYHLAAHMFIGSLPQESIDFCTSMMSLLEQCHPRLVNLKRLCVLHRQIQPSVRAHYFETSLDSVRDLESILGPNVSSEKVDAPKASSTASSLPSIEAGPSKSEVVDSFSSLDKPAQVQNALKEDAALPNLFDFFELFTSGDSATLYMELFLGTMRMVSGTNMQSTPGDSKVEDDLSVWLLWHLETSLAAVSSLPPLLRQFPKADTAERHKKLAATVHSNLGMWTTVLTSLHITLSPLLHASCWHLWPRIVSLVLSPTQSWLRNRTIHSDTIQYLTGVLLYNFRYELPIRPLMDYHFVQTLPHVALGIAMYTMDIQKTGKGTLKWWQSLAHALAAIGAPNRPACIDPRFIDLCLQVHAKAGINGHWDETQNGPSGVLIIQDFMRCIASSGLSAQTIYGSFSTTATHVLDADLNRFSMDVEMRHWITKGCFQLLASLPFPKAFVTNLFVVHEFMYALLMDPNPTLKQLAMDRFEKQMNEDCTMLGVNATRNLKKFSPLETLWTSAARNPKELEHWVEVMKKHFRPDAKKGTADSLVFVCQLHYIGLEYVSQLFRFVDDEARWLESHSTNTQLYLDYVRTRIAMPPPSKYDMEFVKWMEEKFRSEHKSYAPGRPLDLQPAVRSLNQVQLVQMDTNGFVFASVEAIPKDAVKVARKVLKMICVAAAVQPVPEHNASYMVSHCYFGQMLFGKALDLKYSMVPPPSDPNLREVPPTITSATRIDKPTDQVIYPLTHAELYSSYDYPILTNLNDSNVDQCSLFEYLSDCLPLLPAKLFEFEESNPKSSKLDARVAQLCFEVLKRGHSIALVPTSGIIKSLERWLKSRMEDVKAGTCADWEAQLFCVAKPIVCIATGRPLCDPSLDELVINRYLLLPEASAYAALSQETISQRLELCFSLVKYDWPRFERIVVPLLEVVLKHTQSGLIRHLVQRWGTAQDSSSWSLVKVRMACFLALYLGSPEKSPKPRPAPAKQSPSPAAPSATPPLQSGMFPSPPPPPPPPSKSGKFALPRNLGQRANVRIREVNGEIDVDEELLDAHISRPTFLPSGLDALHEHPVSPYCNAYHFSKRQAILSEPKKDEAEPEPVASSSYSAAPQPSWKKLPNPPQITPSQLTTGLTYPSGLVEPFPEPTIDLHKPIWLLLEEHLRLASGELVAPTNLPNSFTKAMYINLRELIVDQSVLDESPLVFA